MKPTVVVTLTIVWASAWACGDSGGVAKAPVIAAMGPEARGGSGAGASPASQGASPSPRGGRVPPAPPELADEPRIDLLHNRYLWHLYQGGLIVPIASEGLRKYDLAYRSPWGPVVTTAGRAGRILGQRTAVLHVPSERAGACAVRLHGYGTARRQRVTVSINGQRAGTVKLAPGWQSAVIDCQEAVLVAGENRIELEVKRSGRAPAGAGRKRAYGLWHSIEILAAQDAAPDAPVPPLSPAGVVVAGGREQAALTGVSRMAMMVEVPEQAWLRVDTGGLVGARLVVRAQRAGGGDDEDAGGQPVVLLDHRQASDSWTRHTISLAALAGSLVRLELAGEPAAGWGEPRIAVRAGAAPGSQESLDSRRAQGGPPGPGVTAVDSVILLVVDTLRADRLTLYGNQRVRTPHITAAATAGGVVFRHNQTASPSSPPSHATIQTGIMPRVHGVSGDKAPLRAGTPMISALASQAGIVTGYVGNNNFAMGRLRQPGDWSHFYEPIFNRKGIDCQPLIETMLAFIGEQEGKRLFVSGLPLEPHLPYRYHPGITDRYFPGPYDPPIGKRPGSVTISRITSGRLQMDETRWKQLHALYDGEVQYVDQCFGTLLQGLEELGRRDDTAIVITSDHGEGMFEHGRMGHAFGHYAELANVPLVLIWPAGHPQAGTLRTIETVTGSFDVAPTVLELLGLEPDPAMQGQSLVAMATRAGSWTPRVVPLEYGRSYALRARRWKYIVDYDGTGHLYDVLRDPTEQHALGASQPLALRYMRDVAGFYLAHRARWRAAGWGDLNNHGPALAADAGE